MSRLNAIGPAQAEPRAKALLDGIQKKLGVTPNMMRVLAVNPAVLGAYLAFGQGLAGGKLGAKLHEQIALAVAEQNGCDYCLAAHSLLGKGAGLSLADIQASRSGKAADGQAAAALDLAVKLVKARGAVSRQDLEAARAASLDDAAIVEVIAAVALNIFTNYLNIAGETDIDFPPVGKLNQAA